ncbi:putative toxin-antitoxin system toxin component, PIN family [Ottowia thiooxydans]|uniref:putative toxin-antitoxin system toxin component, PIN family n=1 Tax=Ottowia thiooxydans TaxID=219182 RepID=UPI0003FCC9FB|nr:putative toxin-antitoxin system toxin component, PIN family [Ottowia thiooxydans]
MTTKLVIDTNVALDLLVFADPTTEALREALLAEKAIWLASTGMRDELARVLDYPKVAPRVAARGLDVEAVLAEFDRLTCIVAPAPTAPCRCADADDQPFIDLAVQHGALLLSKDAAVLSLRRPMQSLGAKTSSTWTG